MRYRATVKIDGAATAELDLEVETLAGALRSIALLAEPVDLEAGEGSGPQIVATLEPFEPGPANERDPRDG